MSQHVRFFTMSISPTLVFCLLLVCTVTCGEECFVINPCGQNLTTPPLDTLVRYKIVTSSWTHNVTMVCPRSDSVNWEISFEDSMGILLEGSYCSDIQFNTPIVCISNNGSLLSFLDLTSFFNKSGSFDIKFTSPTFIANIPFKYAPTGISSTLNTIPLSSIVTNDTPLKWFVYQRNQIDETQIYFNGVRIDNQSYFADEYSFTPDKTVCVGSTVGEKTFVYFLSILSPSLSSVGEYTLIAGGGLYTNIISVVLDSLYITPTSTIITTSTVTSSDAIIIQSSQVMSVSSAFINTSSITVIAPVSSSTPTISPSSVSTDNSLTIILSATISTCVVAIVAIVIVSSVVIALAVWRTRNSTKKKDSDRVHAVNAVNGDINGSNSDGAHDGKSDGGDGGDRGDVRLESFSKRQHSQGPVEEETDFTKPKDKMADTLQHSNGTTNNGNNHCIINSNITGESTNSISDYNHNDNRPNRAPINKLLPTLESHSAPISPLVNPKTPPDQELSSHSELLSHVLDIKKDVMEIKKSQNGYQKRSETKDAERDEMTAETLENVRELMGNIETHLVNNATEYHSSSNTEVNPSDNTEVNCDNRTPSDNAEVHSSDNTEVNNSTITDVHNSSNTEVNPSGFSTSSSSEHVNDDVTSETVSIMKTDSVMNTDSLNNLNDS